MKTKFFSVLLLTCVSVTFFACGGADLGKMFVKKWKLESIQSKAMDDQMAQLKMVADTTKDSAAKSMAQANYKMMTGMLDGIKGSTLEYRLDGTYESNMTMMGQTQTEKGKYSIADGGKKVITTSDKQKVDTISITEMTAEKMTVTMPDGKGSTVSITYTAAQ
ncbi:MAG TPA: VCBS domain-containing protein [Bacteroidia bacterium]|jgi:VCBS repeat-containing protein|nr:VCBS domain-containing protein [Bacteroidia bacterium]